LAGTISVLIWIFICAITAGHFVNLSVPALTLSVGWFLTTLGTIALLPGQFSDSGVILKSQMCVFGQKSRLSPRFILLRDGHLINSSIVDSLLSFSDAKADSSCGPFKVDYN
jgi:hypothetical protein